MMSLLLPLLLACCEAAWINMRLDDEWQCRPIWHPAHAQVLIVVEVLDHTVELEHAKEVQLQIRFPNSAAIAAESRHGDQDNNKAHREIYFTATREGDYNYCMRDVFKDSTMTTAAADDMYLRLRSRRARMDVRSRFKAAAGDAQVECHAVSPTDCELPQRPKPIQNDL